MAVGQVTPNIWKQLLGVYVIWDLFGLGWPTYDEVMSFYKLTYSSRRYCSRTMYMSSRARSIVTGLRTSTVDWRNIVSCRRAVGV